MNLNIIMYWGLERDYYVFVTTNISFLSHTVFPSFIGCCVFYLLLRWNLTLLICVLLLWIFWLVSWYNREEFNYGNYYVLAYSFDMFNNNDVATIGIDWMTAPPKIRHLIIRLPVSGAPWVWSFSIYQISFQPQNEKWWFRLEDE